MKRVDINVDIAEGFLWDEALLGVATSANVCCGSHAGSADLTRSTISRCRERGVRVGLHPGYPDREGMGRRPFATLAMTADDWADELWRQLMPFVEDAAYIKPHGAFYHDVLVDPGLADVLVAVLRRTSLPLMGMREIGHDTIADRAGVALISEGFADRRYTPEGMLVARTQPDAVHNDPVAMGRQAVELAMQVDTVCIHGDTPGCVEAAHAVRSALEVAGFEVGA